jgi:pentatricopeptide repeat protein
MTFSSALGACSSPGALMDGRTVHAMILQLGLGSNLLVGNSLLTMYGKCNSIQDAESVFQSMPTHDVVSCNVLIGSYAALEECTKAMQVFTWMRGKEINPNYITIVNIQGSFTQWRSQKLPKSGANYCLVVLFTYDFIFIA